MMNPMLSSREIVQHKAMNEIFGKRPRNDATGERRGGGGYSERRDRQQEDCQHRDNQHFPEINDSGHGPIRAGDADANTATRAALYVQGVLRRDYNLMTD